MLHADDGTVPFVAHSRSLLQRLPLAKLSRSMAVSIATTSLSLTVLITITATTALDAGVANVLSTVAGIGPSYVLNRHWVWNRTGRGSIRREIAPFWSMCLCSLVLSTLAVQRAADWASRNDIGRIERTAVVVAANIMTFSALWILQFLILDRLLFGRHRGENPDDPHVHSKPQDSAEETARSIREDARHAAPAIGVGRR
jgi:putative flippase GtrA